MPIGERKKVSLQYISFYKVFFVISVMGSSQEGSREHSSFSEEQRISGRFMRSEFRVMAPRCMVEDLVQGGMLLFNGTGRANVINDVKEGPGYVVTGFVDGDAYAVLLHHRNGSSAASTPVAHYAHVTSSPGANRKVRGLIRNSFNDYDNEEVGSTA